MKKKSYLQWSKILGQKSSSKCILLYINKINTFVIWFNLEINLNWLVNTHMRPSVPSEYRVTSSW